ncbi:MAG: CotH kinase family protein, partial [Planctomycetota bacterium]
MRRCTWFLWIAQVSFATHVFASTPDVFISEVLASNAGGLLDEDDDASDWIEVCSTAEASIDLGGFFLTDNARELERWQFPSVALEPGECLVVFASAKNRRDAAAELHTNFRVDDSGEYVALVAPDGRTVVSAPPVPPLSAEVSFGRLGNASIVRELVSSRSDARFLVATETIPSSWQDPFFVDSSWSRARASLGYEVDARGPFTGAFETDLAATLPGESASVLLRVPFFVENPAAVEALTLWMRCDDAFVAYVNGVEVARENIAGAPSWDDAASTDRSDSLAVGEFLEIDLGDRQDLLRGGLNVLAIHGLNSSVDADRFLLVPSLEARVALSDDDCVYGYFSTPTPSVPNGDGFPDRVRDTRFSIDRGFYDANFDVVITSDTPDAVIRYTLDGSEPTSTHGAIYSRSISISSNRVLRAMAYRPGFLETNVDTQSYFRSTSAAIRSLDVVSIAGDPVSVFSVNGGLYEDPILRGTEAERRVSVEFLNPSLGLGVQRDVGLRLHGSSYRRRTIGPNPNAKWSFRIYARNRYDGSDEFSYPLIGTSDVETHRVVVLRGGYNDSSNPFIKDELARRLFVDMGNVASFGTVVHTFINGRLKNNGYYNPVERVGEPLLQAKFGSDESWDVVTKWGPSGTPADPPRDFESQYIFDVRDGDQHSFQALLDFASTNDLGDASNYAEVARRLNLDAYVDYLILQGYARIRDWPHNNWIAGRERSDGPLGAWRFYPWDLEFGWRDSDLGASFKTPGSDSTVPLAVLFTALRENEEFCVLFGDRAQKHFFSGGGLHGDNVVRRFDELRETMSLALPNMNAFIRNTWAHQRPPNVISSLTSLGLFTSEGPRIEVDDEDAAQRAAVSDVSTVTIRNPPGFPGTAYYRLDGADPRLPGGALDPDATIASVGAATTRTLISANADLRYLGPLSANDAVGLSWTEPSFDDEAWTAGRSGVGYERQSGYEDLIASDVEAEMFDVTGTVYVRLRFSIDDPDAISGLQLRMRYDDGFRAYLNGSPIASRNSPGSPGWNSTATSSHSDAAAVVAEEILLPDALGLLVTGENVLAIHGMNTSTTSSDFLIVPELL